MFYNSSILVICSYIFLLSKVQIICTFIKLILYDLVGFYILVIQQFGMLTWSNVLLKLYFVFHLNSTMYFAVFNKDIMQASWTQSSTCHQKVCT